MSGVDWRGMPCPKRLSRAAKHCTYRGAGCEGHRWCGGQRHMTDREWRRMVKRRDTFVSGWHGRWIREGKWLMSRPGPLK